MQEIESLVPIFTTRRTLRIVLFKSLQTKTPLQRMKTLNQDPSSGTDPVSTYMTQNSNCSYSVVLPALKLKNNEHI